MMQYAHLLYSVELAVDYNCNIIYKSYSGLVTYTYNNIDNTHMNFHEYADC